MTQANVQCRLCGHLNLSPGLPLGRQPICNQLTRTGIVDTRIDLEIVECETCQLVQLRNPPPIDAIVPRLPWIRYREPEAHLSSLAESLLALRPGARKALGTGPFEQPLLARLAGHGLEITALELDVTPSAERYPYLESWQASLNAPRLSEIAANGGTFDLVSCRYIVEHSPHPVATLIALKLLLSSDGLLLIEVPDSAKFLAARDYCFLWEEHSCYFIEETLVRLAETAGFRVLSVLRYEGALEDALVAVLEVVESPCPINAPLGTSILFQDYRDNFAATRTALQARLAGAAGPARNRVALFGIGHHAIMFVNVFGLSEYVALAVDDDKNKAGFFPPGFGVPVVGSERLLADERIRLCLFAVPPAIEGKVREKLATLAARGVEFRSIYAALDNSIMKDPAP